MRKLSWDSGTCVGFWGLISSLCFLLEKGWKSLISLLCKISSQHSPESLCFLSGLWFRLFFWTWCRWDKPADFRLFRLGCRRYAWPCLMPTAGFITTCLSSLYSVKSREKHMADQFRITQSHPGLIIFIEWWPVLFLMMRFQVVVCYLSFSRQTIGK